MTSNKCKSMCLKRRKSDSKDSNDSEDEIFMIKCDRFTFGPKNNKVINFCYTFDSESESENESEDSERKSEEVDVTSATDKLSYVAQEPVTPVTSNEALPKAELTPIEVTVIESSNKPLCESPNKSYVVSSIEHLSERPSTPKNQILEDSQLQLPTTPEEVKKLRDMKISKSGRYVIDKNQLIEIRRKELQLDEERKKIREQEIILNSTRHNLTILEQQCVQRFDELMRMELAYRAQREIEFEEVLGRAIFEREMTVRNEMGARIAILESMLMHQGAMTRDYMITDQQQQQQQPWAIQQVQQNMLIDQHAQCQFMQQNHMNMQMHDYTRPQANVIQNPVQPQVLVQPHTQTQQQQITNVQFPQTIQTQKQQGSKLRVEEKAKVITMPLAVGVPYEASKGLERLERGRTKDREFRINSNNDDTPPVVGLPSSPVLSRQMMFKGLENTIHISSKPAVSIEDIQREMLEKEDKKADAFSILKTIPNVFNSMFGGGGSKSKSIEDDI